MNLHIPVKGLLPACLIAIASLPAAACILSGSESAKEAYVERNLYSQDTDSYGKEVMARVIESFDEAVKDDGGDRYADTDSIKPEVMARIVESFEEEC